MVTTGSFCFFPSPLPTDVTPPNQVLSVLGPGPNLISSSSVAWSPRPDAGPRGDIASFCCLLAVCSFLGISSFLCPGYLQLHLALFWNSSTLTSETHAPGIPYIPSLLPKKPLLSFLVLLPSLSWETLGDMLRQFQTGLCMAWG